MPIISKKLSPGLSKIIRNVGWLSLEKALGMILNLTIGLYLIRYLSSNDFGKLSYCLSIVGIFEALAKLGLDPIVVRNLVKEDESASEILSTAFILKLLSTLINLVLIACVIHVLNQDPQTHWITIVTAFSLVLKSTEVIDFWFQSKVLAKPMSSVRMTKLLIGSVFRLIFILLKLPLAAFVWLLLLEEIIGAVGAIIVFWHYKKPSHIFQRQLVVLKKFNYGRAKELLRDSWPLILSGVMVTIYMKMDQVMLGNMSSNEAVGNYAAAIRFSEVWYFFSIAICSSVFPSIIRAKQKSEQEYYEKLQQLYDLMAWLSISIAVIMTFASGILVRILLGEEYAQAGTILALHIWAGPFVFLGVARSQWLMAENLTQFSFACTSLGAVTNLILNLWLIPLYDGSGAAIATVISYGIASHVTCIAYPKMFKTGWMLTKALFVPLRIRQNIAYLKSFRKIIH